MLRPFRRPTTVSAQSSSSARRPKILADSVRARCSSEKPFDQSVLSTPGEMELTVIFGAQAFAMEAAKWIAAAFDTAKGGSKRNYYAVY